MNIDVEIMEGLSIVLYMGLILLGCYLLIRLNIIKQNKIVYFVVFCAQVLIMLTFAISSWGVSIALSIYVLTIAPNGLASFLTFCFVYPVLLRGSIHLVEYLPFEDISFNDYLERFK